MGFIWKLLFAWHFVELIIMCIFFNKAKVYHLSTESKWHLVVHGLWNDFFDVYELLQDYFGGHISI